jgi:hypothetical protein
MALFHYLDNQRTLLINTISNMLRACMQEDGNATGIDWGRLCRDVRLYLDAEESDLLKHPAETPLLRFKMVYARKLHDDVEHMLDRAPADDHDQVKAQLTELLDLLRSIDAYERHVICPLAKEGVSCQAGLNDGHIRKQEQYSGIWE